MRPSGEESEESEEADDDAESEDELNAEDAEERGEDEEGTRGKGGEAASGVRTRGVSVARAAGAPVWRVVPPGVVPGGDESEGEVRSMTRAVLWSSAARARMESSMGTMRERR